MHPSVLREILKVAERPGVKSMAGGLPSPLTFPVEAIRAACERVLTDAPAAALQYAASEGFTPLREWVAGRLSRPGYTVGADQVLITTGSQQGLDLVAKVLVDAGSPVAVEQPTYLGALQAYIPYEPVFVPLQADDDGPTPESIRGLATRAPGTRFAYLLPNFQNPTGGQISDARRDQIVAAAAEAGVPIVEDNPYGDIWFDEPPPPSMTSRWPDGCVYLGSFSKVLTPGFRLGFLVAPRALHSKILSGKQAADLHTPGFNQRVVYEIVKDGFLDRHVPTIRERYRAQRDAMAEALRASMPPGTTWQEPKGGMFFWIRLPEGYDTMPLLEKAVEAGIAFVPGAPFYTESPDSRTMRLSFVTLTTAEIGDAVAALGRVVAEAGAAAVAK
ncbi:MAG: PLP-dependent aminotransferase family protein [Vicinamibacterales bacterium]